MNTLQEYLSKSTQHVAIFLERELPCISPDDWWDVTVLEKLSPQQLAIASQKNFTKLADFDQAALLNILERNWRSITDQRPSLDYRRGLNLIFELKNIRNHYAHEPSSGTDLDQQIRDADSIVRLMRTLGSDEEHIGAGELIHRGLMLEMLKGGGTDAISKPVASDEIQDVETETETETETFDVFPGKTTSDENGIPLNWLRAGTILEPLLQERLSDATFVGIDFGTSTSVASIASFNVGGIHSEPVEIRQLDQLGREAHSHLVDTCLAWFNNQLLFGIGAAELKQDLVANQAVWSSFKMGLGIDLGPVYNRTTLPSGRFEYEIEKPQDAAAVFLKLLCQGIRAYVAANGLAEKIYYTVTVPASFEANQRRDLFTALEFAGIPESEIQLMDEPNAAFLSYLIDMESRSRDARFVDVLKDDSKILVFDFGAGTCDISILELSVSQASILSKNLGISKFWALGGDDIDNLIAEKILLPQLVGEAQLAKYIFTTTQLEQQVIPRLKPVAEALKIACCELCEQKGWEKISDLRSDKSKVTTKPSKAIVIQNQHWKLDKPQIRMSEFAEIMALFLGEPSSLKTEKTVIDVLQPIKNALEKVELSSDDIQMVLFIGGSCENPLIRRSVSDYLGRFVESVVPRDLRAHVSQGAALYTLLIRGANIDPIKPITSEAISVLTAGEKLEKVIGAGTEVPSQGSIENEFEVAADGQKTIDLPFFSGTVNKPIGLVQIKAVDQNVGFSRGDSVKIRWAISKEKILRVEAIAGGCTQLAEFHNPLANDEVSADLESFLLCKQKFNESVLAGKGRPTIGAALSYARCAQKAEQWRLAAEMLEAVEKLDSDSDHATLICYCYAMDGDHKSSHRWSEIAYERNPDCTTAYNLGLDFLRKGDSERFEQLMRESLDYSPNYTAALTALGEYLVEEGDEQGYRYLQRAFDIYQNEYDDDELDASDLSRFTRVASTLGKDAVVTKLKKRRDQNKSGASKRLYDVENLVAGKRPQGKAEY